MAAVSAPKSKATPIFTTPIHPPKPRSEQIGGSPLGRLLGAPGDPQMTLTAKPPAKPHSKPPSKPHSKASQQSLTAKLPSKASQQSTEKQRLYTNMSGVVKLPIARLWRPVCYNMLLGRKLFFMRFCDGLIANGTLVCQLVVAVFFSICLLASFQ